MAQNVNAARSRKPASVHHRRRPRHNNRAVSHHRRRRNPMGGSWGAEVTQALYIIAGAIGSKLGAQMVLGSSNTGFMGYGANLAAGGIAGLGGQGCHEERCRGEGYLCRRRGPGRPAADHRLYPVRSVRHAARSRRLHGVELGHSSAVRGRPASRADRDPEWLGTGCPWSWLRRASTQTRWRPAAMAWGRF